MITTHKQLWNLVKGENWITWTAFQSDMEDTFKKPFLIAENLAEDMTLTMIIEHIEKHGLLATASKLVDK